MKGILARDGELWDEAIDCLKESVRLNPNLVWARLELAYAYYKKGLYDLEAGQYEEVLKMEPENADALFGLAICLQMKGKYDAAIEKYEKLVTVEPEDDESQYELAIAQLAQGGRGQSCCRVQQAETAQPG